MIVYLCQDRLWQRYRDIREILLEKKNVGLMINILQMRSERFRKCVFKLKQETDCVFALDNGAYQTWKYKIRFCSPEYVLHFGRKLECDLIVAQDVVGNPVKTRKYHKFWSKWTKDYPLLAVLQGATVSREEMYKDIEYFHSIGYEKFAFPCVAGGLQINRLLQSARKKVKYLHGLGFARIGYLKWLSCLDSFDIGLWRTSWIIRDGTKNWTTDTIMKFIDKTRNFENEYKKSVKLDRWMNE